MPLRTYSYFFLVVLFMACGGGVRAGTPNPPPGRLEGTTVSGLLVKGATGTVAAANVSVELVGPTSLSQQTAADGSFLFEGVKPGKYQLKSQLAIAAPAPSYLPHASGSYAVSITEVVVGGNPIDLGNLFLPGALAGTVTLIGATDFTGIDVFVPGSSFVAKTDSNGDFVLLGIQPGTYSIHFSKYGYQDDELKNIEVVSGEVTTIPNVTLNMAMTTGVTPTLLSIFPGTASGGDTINVSGTNLGLTQGTSQIYVGGVTQTVSSWSDTSLTFVLRENTTVGSKQVVVSRNGVGSNALSLTIVGPNILTITPSSAIAGDTVTLTGTNFGSAQASSQVYVGGITQSVSSWNDTSVAFTLGDSTPAGTNQVAIVRNGIGSNTLSLQVQVPYVLVSLSDKYVILGLEATWDFEVVVTGSANHSVTWSILESGNVGSVSAGIYSSPNIKGVFHIKATSVANPNAFDVATVFVDDICFSHRSSYDSLGTLVVQRSRGVGLRAPYPGDGTGTTEVNVIYLDFQDDVTWPTEVVGVLQGVNLASFDANGRIIESKKLTEAGSDGLWGTNDDVSVIQASYEWSQDAYPAVVTVYSPDVSGSQFSRIRQWALNEKGFTSIGRLSTADDEIQTVWISTFDENGFPSLTTEYVGSGTDGVWFTEDDLVSGMTVRQNHRWVSYLNFQGWHPAAITYYSNSGTDGIWMTDDDAQENAIFTGSNFGAVDSFRSDGYMSYVFQDTDFFYESLPSQFAFYSSPGSDATWKTADDIMEWIYSFTLDAFGLPTRAVRYASSGTDQTWGTADDVIDNWVTLQTDSGRVFESTGYGSPGTDEIWLTGDDEITSTQTYRYYGTCAP